MEQRRFHILDIQHRTPVFTRQGPLHFAAELVRQVLGSIAYSKKGIFPFDSGEVDLRCVCVPYGAWTAGEDDTLYVSVHGRNLVERIDFAINIQLAEPAPDQLGNLGSEIEDDDLFSHRGVRFKHTNLIIFSDSVGIP